MSMGEIKTTAALRPWDFGVGGPVGVIPVNFSAGAGIGACGLLNHGDAILHGADFNTKVACHTFIIQYLEMALAILALADGLVRGVLADGVAAATLDAEVLIDLGS
jgi:hypothetical protein